jgi:hypothetical protein
MPGIYDRIAEDSERIVQDLAELEAQLVDQLREQAGDLAPRDTAGAIRNVSVAKAVNIDKASVIRGRPTEIAAEADVTELLRALNSFGGVVKVNPVLLGEEPEIESTAEEEPDASEVVISESGDIEELRARTAELEAKAAARGS